MNKILKKISASFILILMLFSISFNIISYAANFKDNEDGTVTITSTSGKFKLILPKEMVDEESGGQYLTAGNWSWLLTRYDGYYDTLKLLTNFDPIANNASYNCITLDFTTNDFSSASGNAGATANRSNLLIRVKKDRVSAFISPMKGNLNSESDFVVHELCHLFQENQDWVFNREITVLLAETAILDGKSVISGQGITYSSFLEYLSYRYQGNLGSGYDKYNEIAYQLLANSSASQIQSAIQANNSCTAGTDLERFEKFIKSLNSITGKDLSVLRLSTDNNKTIYQYMGGSTESVNGNPEVTGNITINLQTDGTKSSTEFKKGKDTKIKVSGTVTVQNATVEKVYVNYNNQRLDATVTAGNNSGQYIYEYTITPAANSTAGEKEITAIAKLSNTDVITSEKKKITFVKEDDEEEIAVEITELSVKGDKTQKESIIDIDKDEYINVTVKIKTIAKLDNNDGVKIQIGSREYPLVTNHKTSGNISTYQPALQLNAIKEELKNNPKITVKAILDGKEVDQMSKNLSISSEDDVTIGDIQFVQDSSTKTNKYDIEGEKTAKISVDISGITKKEELSNVYMSLEGFSAVSRTTEVNSNNKLATTTISVKQKEDAEFKNGKITGTVKLVINQKLISKEFEVEIINAEEKEEKIEIKYYDWDKKAYVVLNESTNTLNVTATDSYTFSVKITGIEKGKTVSETINGTPTATSLKDSNGVYSKGIVFNTSGKYEIIFGVSDTIIKTLTLNVTIEKNTTENKALVLYAEQHRNDLYIPDGWDEGVTKEYSLNKYNTNGEDFFIFRDTKDKKISYFCFHHGGSLDPSEHYILFDGNDYTSLSTEQQLILAFLGEVESFTDSSGQTITFNEDLRYGVQQFYIWGKVKNQSVKYGIFDKMIQNLTTLENNKNDYIDVDAKTITVNEKTKILTEFKATEYTPRAQYSYNGEIFELGDYVQPFFKYTYKLRDGGNPPKLKKVNEDGDPISGAKFAVYVKGYEDKWYKIAEDNEFETDENGLTKEIPTKANKIYLIVESKAPTDKDGTEYTPTTQYLILKTNAQGEASHKVYQAKTEEIDPKTGYIKVTTTNLQGTDDALISDSKLKEWKSDEAAVEAILKVINKKSGIPLEKVDGDDEKTFIPATFRAYKLDETTNKYVAIPNDTITDGKGKINLKGISPAQKATYLIKEIETKETYSITKEYIILEIDPSAEEPVKMTVKMAKNEEDGVAKPLPSSDKTLETSEIWKLDSSETTEDGNVIYKIIVKNYKKTIRLKKVDESTNKALKGAIFEIYKENGGKLVTTGVKTEPSNNSGNIDIAEIFKDSKCYTELTGGKKQIILKEQTAPNGYEISQAVYIIVMDNKSELTGTYYETEENWKNKKDVKELEIDENTAAIKIKNSQKGPSIKISKYDGKGKAIIGKGGVFQITVKTQTETILSETKTLNDKGTIDINFTAEQMKKITSNLSEEKHIPVTIEIEEKTPPDGFTLGKNNIYTILTYYYEGYGWQNITVTKGEANCAAYQTGGEIRIVIINEPDVPRIKVDKTDEDGERINRTVEFTVYSDEGCTIPVGEPITVIGDYSSYAELDIKANEEKVYYLKETKTPAGYEQINYVIKVLVKTNKDGQIESMTPSLINNGTGTIKYKPTAQLSGNLITFNIKNPHIEVDKLKLKILKIDRDNGDRLSDATFEITGDIENGTYTGNTITGGTLGPLKYVSKHSGSEKLETNTTYRVTIKEIQEPVGYKKIEEDIVVSVYIDENGKIRTPELETSVSGVTVSLENDGNEKIIKVTIGNVKKTPSYKFPLLMYIEGQVWLDQLEGKNSKADGYYTSADYSLEGILVELFESDGVTPAVIADPKVVATAIKTAESEGYYINPSVQAHSVQLLKGAKNYTTTDDKGKFKFYGLDPAKKYVVKFTYNGMRYEEIKEAIKVNTTTSISGYDTTQPNSSKAYEDPDKRQEIIDAFKEIGPYPANYFSKSKNRYNTIFTQNDVEEEVSYKDYGKYIQDLRSKTEGLTDIEAFIKDTSITATIGELGNILSAAEKKIQEENRDKMPNKEEVDMVYPVVKVGQTFRKTGEESLKEASEEAENIVNESITDAKVAWFAQEHKYYKELETKPDHFNIVKNGGGFVNGDGKSGNYKRIDDKTYWIGGAANNYGSNCHEGCVEKEKTITYGGVDKDGNEYSGTYTITYHDPATEHHGCQKGYQVYTWNYEKNYTDASILYIEEGYKSKVVSGVRFAVFDEDHDPYLAQPPKPDKRGSGMYDGECQKRTKFGWYDIKRDINEIYFELAAYVDSFNRADAEGRPSPLICANLGVLYRPTMDLGLYNDVVKADVEINSKSETYIYDKRASDGKGFKFGINEYDLANPNTDYENEYAEYYSKLSKGERVDANVAQTTITYENLRQKEDIFPNTTVTSTDTGKAEAGAYPIYPISIKLTYKIRIINQAGEDAKAREIVDYYDKDFKFNGAYKDKEKTQSLNCSDSTLIYSDRNATTNPPDKYKAKYIQLEDLWLKNNESTYIFIELEMIDPRTSLAGKLEEGGEGFKTLNFAEIYGYSTKIGVLDIDSVPGNLTTDGRGRFDNGAYEDDESKSPTFIIKNPGKERIIKGTLFEDKTDEKTNTNSDRNGDGIFKDGEDKKVVGGLVQLIEIDSSGNIKTSTTDNGTGIRAETLTNENGEYEFHKVVAGDYKIRFTYGKTYETVLTNVSAAKITKENQKNTDPDLLFLEEGRTVKLQNNKSYNGQDYENAVIIKEYSDPHWYTDDKDTRHSDAKDIQTRRISVRNYSASKIDNEIAEIFNSYKDSDPNEDLVRKLRDNTWMNAQTALMSIEVENYEEFKDNIVRDAAEITVEGYIYEVNNVDFGIQERERAELEIKKEVSYISIVDSSGKEITGGNYNDWKNGKIKYVKWISGSEGFVDMEIDKELLSGALLKITYAITVSNNSEAGNTISDIQVIDYVTNNLNYAENYYTKDVQENSKYGWETKTTENVEEYLNKTSLQESLKLIGNPGGDTSNAINLGSAQTILMANFGTISPGGESVTKYLTLEKNLSSDESSNFNYENQVEIVSSKNATGRGDYSSIYGNLDPSTYTSKRGNLNWDPIDEGTQTTNKGTHNFVQMLTNNEVKDGETVSDINARRQAEKDSGNAEEVIITPPTGAKGIVFQTQHYILALIGLISLAGAIILVKKYIIVTKE